MFYQMDETKVLEHTSAALVFLSRYKLKAVPGNYAIAFDYVSEQREDVVQHIKQLLENKKVLTDEMMESIYQEYYLSVVRKTEELLEPLGNLMDQLLERIQESSDGQQGYLETLEKSNKALAADPSPDSLKPIVSSLLEATEHIQQKQKNLTSELEQAREESQFLKSALKKTRLQAMTDALTKLLNRNGLKQEMLRWQKDDVDATLLILDVDFFKKINDNWGHSIGDRVLSRVAREISSHTKGKDLVGRWGGEEFVVLLRDTHLADGLVLAEEIRAAVEAMRLVNTKTKQKLPPITISIGVAEIAGWDHWNEAFDQADQAVYKAKENGRNQVCS